MGAKRSKHILKVFVGIVLVFAMTFGTVFIQPLMLQDIFVENVVYGDTTSDFNVTFRGTYQQSMARSMLSMINDFRTGNQAWAWNESDTEKISYPGLGTLTYDYELEKIAMQRAAELVALYDHTRPDGSKFFTAYTDTYTNSYKGENIAIGTSDMDVTRVFELWREDEESYSGQGHRRNMLDSSYNAVGIAHVYYKGCHYWVQEFSSKIGSNVYTAPNDSESDMTVSIAPAYVESNTLQAEYGTKSLLVQETAALPKVYHVIKTSTWAYAPALEYEAYPQWSVTSGSSAVSISGNSYTGIVQGEAVITGTYDNKTVNINVSVNNPEDPIDKEDWEYKISEDGNVEITRYIGERTEVEIPRTMEGKRVTNIRGTAFAWCDGLTSIVIPATVENIGEGAFSGHEDNLTIYGEIGSYAGEYAEEWGIRFRTGKPCATNTTVPALTMEASPQVCYVISLLKFLNVRFLQVISDFTFPDSL